MGAVLQQQRLKDLEVQWEAAAAGNGFPSYYRPPKATHTRQQRQLQQQQTQQRHWHSSLPLCVNTAFLTPNIDVQRHSSVACTIFTN